MKELQESMTAALSGFKSLQSYLAEPSMQASIHACLLFVCFFSRVSQPAELLGHLQDFVAAFKETVKINEEARKELQRQAAERMVGAAALPPSS